ncbi:hypothetical protein ANACOL_02063 [Anaerotruncus colihominis DSM 17241]|uniref:Uncharacterized protein n=1 Tax=Anaerotruncus colihominis DSM 17241 TaxID=445972 RepID=B0PBB1_9FIRM|nr:hypothetical protein ANACOL_02063 [Anaerotruncus colihominis DSM 17241]
MARSAPHSSSIGYQVQSFAWVGQPLTGRIRQSLTLVRAQPFAVRVLLFVRACAEAQPQRALLLQPQIIDNHTFCLRMNISKVQLTVEVAIAVPSHCMRVGANLLSHWLDRIQFVPLVSTERKLVRSL